MKKGVLWE